MSEGFVARGTLQAEGPLSLKVRSTLSGDFYFVTCRECKTLSAPYAHLIDAEDDFDAHDHTEEP